MNTSHLRVLTVLWSVLSVPFPTKPTLVTVPLIVEGNAPIIALEFPMQSGKLRKARFLVDTGGGALLLGNKLVADVGAKADGPPISERSLATMKEMGEIILSSTAEIIQSLSAR